MKKKIRLSEHELHNVIKESVKRIIREGYQTVTNDEGEPLGTEYIREPYEEEEAHWEEMNRRAEDPMYAASQENERWLQAAYNAFEQQGIEVPQDVVYRLAQEMRRKQRETAKESEMQQMKPYVDFIQKMGYDARAYYQPETPDEVAYGYIEAYKDGKSISREDARKIIDAALGQGLNAIEDYLSY